MLQARTPSTRSNAFSRELSLEEIAAKAPSVFALEPWQKMSDKYRFFPTIEVVNEMKKNGFRPVSAAQSKTRIEGKENFTRHVLRFRHDDFLKAQPGSLKVGEEIPELVLMNSHDGSSSYILELGFFRLVCANGLIVASSSVESIRTRHSGSKDLVGQVIEGSFKVIEEAPKAVEQIAQWKALTLSRAEQEIFASSAIEVRDTALEVLPATLLAAKRYEDYTNKESGERDLWKTMNVVQENLIRGGIRGRDAKNQSRKLRAVKGIDTDSKINKALWTLTEKMAALKAAA